MNAISSVESKRTTWQFVIMLTVGFWLSANLVLDWVVMPSLYFSGMMNQAGFTTAGYVVFWNFNRVELLAAAVILTSVLALIKTQSLSNHQGIALSVLMLAVAFIDTCLLTPQMCAVGINLNLFTTDATVPAAMNLLHGGYFALETFKLVVGGMLLNWCWRQA